MKDLTYIRQLFSGQEDSFASVLLGIVIREFGTEALEWENETIESEVMRVIGVEMRPTVKNRLYAAMAVLSSNIWEYSPQAFNNICNAFGDGVLNMNVFEPATPQEIAWTLTEISLMDAPNPMDPKEENLENKLSREVKDYIASVIQYYAIRPQGIFEFLGPQYDFDYSNVITDDPTITTTLYAETEKAYSIVEEYVKTNLIRLQQQLLLLGIQTRLLPS